MISIVVPVYGCPEALSELTSSIDDVLKRIDEKYELILINDSCPKGSWGIIEALVKANPCVIGVNFTRNFGQHYAITAGLEQAKGDLIVVMDCDLQDNPNEIESLYEAIMKENVDVALASRKNRLDSYFKKIGSKYFYKFLSVMTNTEQDPSVANFGIYRRKVINSYLEFKEKLRFFPVNIGWMGFSTIKVNVKHNLRFDGVSSYSLRKLLALASSVIVSFSDKPLWFMVRAGFVISIGAFIFALYVLVIALFTTSEIVGWSSIMVSIWFMFGMLTMMLGVVGIYVAHTFDESKNRPLFIIDKIIKSPKSEV